MIQVNQAEPQLISLQYSKQFLVLIVFFFSVVVVSFAGVSDENDCRCLCLV